MFTQRAQIRRPTILPAFWRLEHIAQFKPLRVTIAALIPVTDGLKSSTCVRPSRAAALASTAAIHAILGDMHLRLFLQQAPKAVIENFIAHVRSAGYYDGVVFHRVIAKFVIQTGDPLGDGTAGTSISEIANSIDEFSDEPYTVSMANASLNTNGSQFFITTNATEWLDKMHTIFGRVLSGLETIRGIENVKTNKASRPYEDIKIVNIDIELVDGSLGYTLFGGLIVLNGTSACLFTKRCVTDSTSDTHHVSSSRHGQMSRRGIGVRSFIIASSTPDA